jgi:hypothetical protein
VQFVASSPTIFPADYVEEMQALLDRAPPVPWPTIRHVPLGLRQLNAMISIFFSIGADFQAFGLTTTQGNY